MFVSPGLKVRHIVDSLHHGVSIQHVPASHTRAVDQGHLHGLPLSLQHKRSSRKKLSSVSSAVVECIPVGVEREREREARAPM